MGVVVQLALEVALILQSGGPATPALQQIMCVAAEFGVSLHPIHPGATHPLLAPYFTVDLPELSAVQQFIEQLRGQTGVVAAYVEPPISPPGYSYR
jgi:hypothetical protein